MHEFFFIILGEERHQSRCIIIYYYDLIIQKTLITFSFIFYFILFRYFVFTQQTARDLQKHTQRHADKHSQEIYTYLADVVCSLVTDVVSSLVTEVIKHSSQSFWVFKKQINHKLKLAVRDGPSSG